MIVRAVVGALATAALACCAPGTALAAGAPGSIAFGSCVSEPLAELCGSAVGYGLEDPAGVAVSPDGSNVYVAGAGGGAVSVLSHGADGSLVFSSCVGGTNSGVDSQCSTAAGMVTPEALAISPDGRNVYVLDHGQIDIFARGASGSLSWAGCVGDADQTGCAPGAPGHTLYPYHYPGAIVVSPDGNFVYTATDDGGGPNGAIDEFARSEYGSLTGIGCVDATGGTESGCSSQSPAIVAAGSLAISSAGYLFAGSAGGVASFKIGGRGTLSSAGCIGTGTGCTSGRSLTGANASPNALALSPDGTSLYVAAHDSGAIGELGVSNGALTELACVGAVGTSGCGASASPVCAPTGLAVSGDGADLYVLDGCSQTLTTFARAQSGAIAYQSCLASAVSTSSCAASGPGLGAPVGLAITPDDSQVIVTGQEKDSVAAFGRTAAVAAQISISSPGNGGTYVVGQSVHASYSCARVPGGDPVAACIGSLANGATISTTTAGHKTFTVTATDVAGLQTKETVSYTVVAVGTPGTAGGEGGGGGGGATTAGAGGHGSGMSVRRFLQAHGRWSEQRSKGRHATPYGTVFSFVLSRAATVTLTFTVRSHRRTVTAGKVVVHGRAGANEVAFFGRVGTKAQLAQGTYSVTLTATAAGGRHARVSGLTFTIVAGSPAR